MKKAQVEIGACYIAKVSGCLATVKILSASPYGGWDGRNLVTGRNVRIKSAARLRRESLMARALRYEFRPGAARGR